ncbi:urease accessory protein UreF [Altericista sp. CCNU0014]|uniref:urease accessory protein UreF n=1 Tax=Altericista sp. CCNU0014 TaxID=3082949 RepID=UPI00384D7C6E
MARRSWIERSSGGKLRMPLIRKLRMGDKILLNPSSTSFPLLRLLQLASSTLPVGAYSYSEGLEFLVESRCIDSAAALQDWMTQELRCGAMRMEAGVMLRACRVAKDRDGPALLAWNDWWSAARDTEELRLQSWQMGRSLLRLLLDLDDPMQGNRADKSWPILHELFARECNFAIAFGIVAAAWQIEPTDALLGYLQSWATNLTSAGIKLIPLGQTAGQQLLLNLEFAIHTSAEEILQLPDENLESCGWGLSLASMAHETLYSRLFRS